MKKFLTSALLGCILLTSPLAVATPANAMTQKEAEIVVTFCQQAFRKWQQGDKKFFTDTMDKLDKETQQITAVVCMAYGVGYEDGKKAKKPLIV